MRELQAAASDDKGNWALAETAQLYTDTGHYDRAIEVMKRSVPSYFAVDIPDAAARVLGSAVSASLLVGLEEILRGERTGSLSGGVADPAGIGIQSVAVRAPMRSG